MPRLEEVNEVGHAYQTPNSLKGSTNQAGQEGDTKSWPSAEARLGGGDTVNWCKDWARGVKNITWGGGN